MTFRSVTQLLAAIGALLNFSLVFYSADPGVLEGVGILIGIFLGGICSAPYLFAWIFPVTEKPNGISAVLMFIAVLWAVGFSGYIFWTFLSAAGGAKDPLLIVVVPIYLSVGLGITAAITQFLSSR